MSADDKIKDLGDYDKFIHYLIVADSGFGKTVHAGTAGNALFLTTDPEGTISAKMFGSEAKEWKIETWSELNEAYAYLRDGGIAKRNLKWVIIDNISEAQNLAMFETMKNARDRNKNRDEFVPAIDDYQRSQNMLKVMVKKFHDLPVNIMWTAWQVRHSDPDGEVYFAPAIHGQDGALAQTIAGYMNITGYGQVIEDDDGKEHRRIWFSHHDKFRGKDRYNVLGKARDDLDVPKLETLVTAALKRAEAKKTGAPARPVAKKPVATRRPVARQK